MLEIKNLRKIYKENSANAVTALKDVNLKVEDGDFLAIMGESGSGKTTLLNIISLIDKETSGQIFLDDKEILSLSDKEKSDFRRDNFGYIFQDFNLLDNFDVRENILLPLVLREENPDDFDHKLMPIVNKLGIADLLNKYPAEISGGQKQRVAVARALIINPKIILADEPTGQLDSSSSEDLLKYFEKINAEGNTILMVTHSNIAASFAKRVLFIRDGKIFNEIYKADDSRDQFYKRISDSLNFLRAGKNETH
ncbi:ABC transporter ATP-binding protein [Anaerococcus sp. NML200537]|uniref:ABC transporter ATP-binding protein n=1 Tax=Anaerococcus sp. NML200537 TaxID=2954485 RepID=UPI002237C978|nr:ABC transporter ATP-binding protein [Anaerococcus sp. NML200537]MCW6700479.1 ABC transporter ATP-binding protein [Anaerococcus sp. NML200537]